MIKKQFRQSVISNERIAQNTYLLKLDCEDDFLKRFVAGQFAHIKIPQAQELLLRRPISINDVDLDKKEVHFIYQTAGKGTTKLAQIAAGAQVEVLMPLGNGFRLPQEAKNIWLIGGGVGVAPLKAFGTMYPDRKFRSFLGFRGAAFAYQVEDFERFSEVRVATDDGTLGHCGFAVQLLAEQLKQERPDAICACGPAPFFRALACAVPKDILTYVSLEQHMGCGTGGCAVCVCAVGGEYKKVCLQGPVFEMREVNALYD